MQRSHLSLFFWIIAFFNTVVYASMPREDYLASLKVAQKYVEQKKAFAAQSPSALSSALLRSLLGRYYEVGDAWDVIAFLTEQTLMRKTGDPDQLQSKGGRIGAFHYAVTRVKTGENPEVTIEVTQSKTLGLSVIDPQIQRLVLTMNDKLVQSQKTYFLQGSSQPVPASAEGVHTQISLLELFPLDVPEVLTAERQSVHSIPTLPEPLTEIVKKIEFKPDLNRSSWFAQDDFFGRLVQFLWQQGDPWPCYLKTPNGIAILISKGTSS